jgi:nucleotide-binding universal stress UspA family protein
MDMGQKILVPLDGSTGSEAVLPAARELAELRGATLRLLHVAPVTEPVFVDGRVVAYADQETSRLTHQAISYLQRIAAGFTDHLGVEFAVRFGDPAREIAEEAQAAGADLIAMATHPWSRVTRLVRASVTSEVERRSHVPVLVVQYGSPVLV